MWTSYSFIYLFLSIHFSGFDGFCFTTDKSYCLQVKPHITNRHGELVPNIFQTNYGALTVMSLVGRQFGCRVQLTKGWSTILYPTPELWTLTLPHRTQIIYSTDISMVTLCSEYIYICVYIVIVY